MWYLKIFIDRSQTSSITVLRYYYYYFTGHLIYYKLYFQSFLQVEFGKNFLFFSHFQWHNFRLQFFLSKILSKTVAYTPRFVKISG